MNLFIYGMDDEVQLLTTKRKTTTTTKTMKKKKKKKEKKCLFYMFRGCHSTRNDSTPVASLVCAATMRMLKVTVPD